jgi:hypothetical protein
MHIVTGLSKVERLAMLYLFKLWAGDTLLESGLARSSNAS